MKPEFKSQSQKRGRERGRKRKSKERREKREKGKGGRGETGPERFVSASLLLLPVTAANVILHGQTAQECSR
jgi:hypothetical protein